MKNRVFILLSIIFGLLQGPFLPASFMEGFLAVVLICPDAERIPTDKIVSLFLGGLLFDLLQGRILGATSLLFLSMLGVLAVVGGLSKRPSFLALVSLVLVLVRGRILFESWFIFPSIFSFLLSYLFFRFVRPLHRSGIFSLR